MSRTITTRLVLLLGAGLLITWGLAPSTAYAMSERTYAGMHTLPDVHVTMEDLLVDGDRAVARVTWSGTHTGRLFGIEPTGKTITFAGFDMVRFVDGKLVEHWGQIDALGLMAQLGFLPEL